MSDNRFFPRLFGAVKVGERDVSAVGIRKDRVGGRLPLVAAVDALLRARLGSGRLDLIVGGLLRFRACGEGDDRQGKRKETQGYDYRWPMSALGVSP